MHGTLGWGGGAGVPGVPSSWSGESTASFGEVWGSSRLKCCPSGPRAWETAPLTFHVPTSSSDPALRSGSGVLFGETASQWASLRLICHCLTGRSDDKKSERRVAEGAARRRSRKPDADSESDKKDEARGV